MHWLHKKKKKTPSSRSTSIVAALCQHVGQDAHTQKNSRSMSTKFVEKRTQIITVMSITSSSNVIAPASFLIFTTTYVHEKSEKRKKKKKKAWEFSEVLPVPASPSFGTRPKHIPEQWSSRTCALTHNTLWNELQHSGVLWWNLLRLLASKANIMRRLSQWPLVNKLNHPKAQLPWNRHAQDACSQEQCWPWTVTWHLDNNKALVRQGPWMIFMANFRESSTIRCKNSYKTE